MTDAQSSSAGAFSPTQTLRDRTGSLSLGTNAALQTSGFQNEPNAFGAHVNGGATQGPVVQTDATTAPNPRVQEVLSSEVGVQAMLNQLKSSIASAKEFSTFLKKRSAAEETLALSLKKLSRSSHDTMHQPEHRLGTFIQSYTEMMHVHEHMAENGMQFALSLHQMHDDLMEMAGTAERNRKSWKTNGLVPEQRVAELEIALRKTKAKYDSLAEDYDRARTGDTSRQSSKMFSLKSKSGHQHEEDLLRKVQAADQDYLGKVQHLQAERAELVTKTRPEAIRALKELVKEMDSAVALQMQKFATFNEKLLLSNGLTISPLKSEGPQSNNRRSLREAVSAINDDKDLNDYIASYHGSLPPNHGEIKYERHPVLSPPQHPGLGHQHGAFQQLPPQMSQQGQFSQQPTGQNQGPQGQQLMSPPAPSGSFQPSGAVQGGAAPGQGFAQGPMSPPGPIPSGQPQQGPNASHGRSFSQGTMLNHVETKQQQWQPQQAQDHRSSVMVNARFGGNESQGPPQLGALPFQNPSQQSPPPQAQSNLPSPPPPQQQQQQQQQGQQQQQYRPPQQPQQGHGQGQFQPQQSWQQGSNAPQQNALPSQQAQGVGAASPHSSQPMQNRQQPPLSGSPVPSRPVFGMPLVRLYERDGLAVPMVVYQCIQAVDLFGLGVEGIYRQSGSVNHINKLKQMFDTDSSSPALDFRNPENFFHDVNSVTGLLKQFFRDLSDPLLTSEHHAALIEAAKHDDDIVRRDLIHAIINNLPDPNYATLRALVLHLHRVMENSHINRMNNHNLAVIFGPTLMGTDPSTRIADAGWQIKAIDTILLNTYQIFDDD